MKKNFPYFSSRISVAAIALLTLFSACGEGKFKIKGEIKDAADMPVVLEKSDFLGQWVPIDSTRTSSSGQFSISRPAPAAPEIFRLSLNGKYIYLPVDSTETITVASSLAAYGSEFTLAGSEKAKTLEAFEKDIVALPANISADSLESFKRSVFTKYLRENQGSIVSYYILTKTIDGKPLFQPEKDYKYFAAVATGFKETRPNDPRTALLEQTSLKALKERNRNNGRIMQIEAEEITVLDIDLPDENGTHRKLSDIVGKGKPTVVIFSLLTHPDSPAINVELSKLFNAKGGSVNFYQVSIDPDQYAWRDAARNLPWVTVFDADGEYSKAAASYNVSQLPLFFIYSAQGELTDRATSIDELRKKI